MAGPPFQLELVGQDSGPAMPQRSKRLLAGNSMWSPDQTWRLLAGALIVVTTAMRVAYLAHNCPLDLAPDEAHYWDWSRHLDWSYYSKGPLVAFLVRVSCALAGGWSQRLTGTEMLAVRLPAVLCGALLLVSLYVLTRQIYRSEWLALCVVALGLTLPASAVGASLMTIDAPYVCCWAWALVLSHQAIFDRSSWAWPAAGLVVGLGILAKYTMVLWIPSLALFLLISPDHRRLLFGPGFWIMAGLAAACCLPILVWNMAHDWVGLRHVQRLSGVSQQGIHWLGPLVFLGGQCVLFLVFWFVVWLEAMVAHRPWIEPDAKLCYLWCMSAPMFTVFLLFSLKTAGGELNWPITAYVAGFVLAAGWLARQLRSPTTWYRRLGATNLTLTCSVGLGIIVLMHRADLVHPLLARLAGPPTLAQPFPLRRYDPSCRLRGWRTLAKEVDRLRSELGAGGREPILAASSWTLPGELGFYCRGHPTVYSVGLIIGDRHSQYDLWRPNPIADGAAFAGRTFILVGYLTPTLARAFDQVDPPQLVTHCESGQPIASWNVIVCRGFRGVLPLPDQQAF
jgi:hypothetical protein